DDRWIGAEAARPERVTQHYGVDGRIGQLRVVEGPAVQGRYTENFEERSDRELVRDFLGIPRAGQHAAAVDESRHSFKRLRAFLPAEVVSRPDRVVASRAPR